MQSRHRAATLPIEDRHRIAAERAAGATLVSLCKKWGFCEHFVRSCIRFPDGPPDPKLPESENGESWKPVPGYEGWYSVSNLGRVRRDRSHIGTRAGKILSTASTRRGYQRVTLNKFGKPKSFNVHRLIALAFLGPCPNGLCINHKSGVKTDNRPENLEYVTNAQNIQHAYDTGLNKPQQGERQHRAKLRTGDVLEIRRLAGAISGRDLANRYGISESCICDIVKRRTWRHVA